MGGGGGGGVGREGRAYLYFPVIGDFRAYLCAAGTVGGNGRGWGGGRNEMARVRRVANVGMD